MYPHNAVKQLWEKCNSSGVALTGSKASLSLEHEASWTSSTEML